MFLDFSPVEANKVNAITANYWGDNEPLEGKDCAVLSGALWKSKSCNSKNHFVCVGENNIYLSLKIGDIFITCETDKHKSQMLYLLLLNKGMVEFVKENIL